MDKKIIKSKHHKIYTRVLYMHKVLNVCAFACVYSQVPLNGHFVKADTSKMDTWSWSLLYFSHLHVLHLPPRWTPL